MNLVKNVRFGQKPTQTKNTISASACNEVVAPEAGVFLVTGLEMTITYYADLFEELDIKPNFAHVGDFKSAVEPYERTGPSDAASEATNALLDSLYDQFIAGISEGRQLSDANIRELLDNPPITPQGALRQVRLTRFNTVINFS